MTATTDKGFTVAKRARTARSTPATYLPFGKPSEVVIERLDAEKLEDGTIIEARYVERFKGLSLDDSKPRVDPDRGDLHPDRCKGRKGVGRVWERDGRTWCRGCYVMRYNEQPPADITFKVRRPASAGPSKVAPRTESNIDKLFRGFKL